MHPEADGCTIDIKQRLVNDVPNLVIFRAAVCLIGSSKLAKLSVFICTVNLEGISRTHWVAF